MSRQPEIPFTGPLWGDLTLMLHEIRKRKAAFQMSILSKGKHLSAK